jgi:hypothetical protein
MADFTRREVTTRRVEFVLPSPTNWAEVGKVLSAIHHELQPFDPENPREPLPADDAVQVKAWDDEIVFWYEVAT